MATVLYTVTVTARCTSNARCPPTTHEAKDLSSADAVREQVAFMKLRVFCGHCRGLNHLTVTLLPKIAPSPDQNR